MKLHKEHLLSVLSLMLGTSYGDPFVKGYLMSLVGQGIISMADFYIFYQKETK